MRRFSLLCALAIILVPSAGSTQQESSAGPYSVVKSAKVGGPGGFDYVYADSASRMLYINRRGMPPAITLYNLDTLAPAGRIPDVNGHGVVVDAPTNHGFTTSKPVVMFDTKTLKPLKNIEVGGNPDGIFYDSFNRRVYILSHAQPYATVIDGASGDVVGTIDLGGAPEQAVSDGKGHVYVDIEDMANIAVVDAKTMAVTAHYDLTGKGGTCAGLAIDAKNGILFAACRNPQNMVILSANDGKIITTASARQRHRRRGVQSQYDGSLQLADGRHADDRQGNEPDQFRGRADGADHAERQDADAGREDEPHLPHRRRVSARPAAAGTRLTSQPQPDDSGFLHDPRRGKEMS